MFWKKIKKAVGHQYDKETDTMTIFWGDGGLRTIRCWTEYEMKLGSDFGRHIKKEMEKTAGREV